MSPNQNISTTARFKRAEPFASSELPPRPDDASGRGCGQRRALWRSWALKHFDQRMVCPDLRWERVLIGPVARFCAPLPVTRPVGDVTYAGVQGGKDRPRNAATPPRPEPEAAL